MSTVLYWLWFMAEAVRFWCAVSLWEASAQAACAESVA